MRVMLEFDASGMWQDIGFLSGVLDALCFDI